jgi:signal transduction histidine kinase/DNA-binding response OmpR family regulator/HAMP domain-containing protein
MTSQSFKSSAKFVQTRTRKYGLNRLKVGKKITLGYVSALGLSIAGTTFGILLGNAHQQNAFNAQIDAQEEVELFSRLQTGVLQVRTHQQQLIPLSESPSDFQEEYSHIVVHADTIRNEWAALKSHLGEGAHAHEGEHSDERAHAHEGEHSDERAHAGEGVHSEKSESSEAEAHTEEDAHAGEGVHSGEEMPIEGVSEPQMNHGDIVQFMEQYDGVADRYLNTIDSLVQKILSTRLETELQQKNAQLQLLAFTNSTVAISFDGISDDLSGFIEAAQINYEQARQAATAAQALRNQIILLSMLSSALVATILTWVVSRSITSPLKLAEEVAAKVVKNEDFTLRIKTDTDDEVGSLTLALNQLIEWVGNRTQALEESRNMLEVRVKERTQELNAIIDNLGNGLLVCDLEGCITRANPALKTIFNQPDAIFSGQLVKDSFDDSIVRLIRQNQAHPEESAQVDIDLPDNRMGQATATAIFSEAEGGQGHEVVGTVVLIRDVTTEKAVDRMKTDFISTVSHELRTPLTSVLGFAKIIHKKLETVVFPMIVSEDKKANRAITQVQENLNIIISEGERLTSLINDVLDIAKIEAGKIEWRMASVQPQDLLNQAIAATSVLSQNKQLTVNRDIADDLPSVIADQDRIVQVMINLLSNAIKFTDNGAITCRAKRSEDEVIISIIDTGMGISVEDQPKVFEKFKQVGEIMTDKPKGTGLGLPICKQIIEHHGGRIWVESKIGEGSTFSFALPLCAAEAEAESLKGSLDNLGNQSLRNQTVEDLVRRIKADVQQATPTHQSTKKKVLVVDDEANIRRLLHQELEAEGYLVNEAKDGVAALESIKRDRPDLIITDIMMPHLDGFDLTAVLKTNPETATIPTLILSIVEDKARGLRLGVDCYLTKPIDVSLLLQNVDKLVSGKSRRGKVLIVDRDLSTMKVLTEVLLGKGYVVAEASSGQEGLDKARSIKPDMMIVEAALSEESNIVRALRFENGLENISLIVVEGDSSQKVNYVQGLK